jgi:hypothetical protein
MGIFVELPKDGDQSPAGSSIVGRPFDKALIINTYGNGTKIENSAMQSEEAYAINLLY